jgi:SOS-response transcriptional repressor LexA
MKRIYADTFAAIRAYIVRNGYAPTVDEIADTLGIGYNTARKRVLHLIRDGYLQQKPYVWRGLRIPENVRYKNGKVFKYTPHESTARYCVECGKPTSRGMYYCSDQCRLAPPKTRSKTA